MNSMDRVQYLIHKAGPWTKTESREVLDQIDTIKTLGDDLRNALQLRASVESMLASQGLQRSANWLAIASVLLALAAVVAAVMQYAKG